MKPLFSLIESLVVLTVLFLPCVAFCAPGSVILPNAWQITDNSSLGGSTLNYTTNLTAAQQMAATNTTGGFRYSVNARFVDDFGSATESMVMIYAMGNRRFLIWWDLDSNSNLTARLEGGNSYTLTTNGTGAGFYHTHEIIFNPTNGTASYVVDGQTKTNNWPGSAGSFAVGQVYWGAGSSSGKGQMNFNRVTFAITNGIVADYDSGTDFGENVTAPDPTNVGWTLNAGSATTATNISPDRGLLLAVSTTRLGFLSDSNVLITGQVSSSGTDVKAWFEWGTDTNYGNVTPIQELGLVTNKLFFNATLPGLLGGPDYHYRAVASNLVGVLKGDDNTFNLRFIRSLVLPELSANTTLGTEHVFVSVTDFDNDGRLDFLLSGDNSTAAAVSQLWRNNADGTFSNLTSVLAPGLVPINGPSAWGDYDNDGRLDFLIAGTTNQGQNDVSTGPTIELWRNTGAGFTNVPLPGVPALYNNNTTLAWRDFDNDGRLDFMLMRGVPSPLLQLWRNTGNGFVQVSLSGVYVFSPGIFQWADYDNDGQADFLAIGGSPGLPFFDPPELWRNTGGSFTNVPLPGLPRFDVSSASLLAFGDYDADGRLDFMVSGFPRSGPVGQLPISQLWRNTSDGFTNVPVPGLPGFTSGKMAWGDYNNDGRLDFLITGWTNVTGPDTSIVCQLWENTPGGFAQKPILPHPDDIGRGTSGGLIGFVFPSLIWADFNLDGRLDILVAGRTGAFGGNAFFGPRLYLNNMSVSSNQPPAVPINLSTTVSGGRVALRWDAATDDTTPTLALTYNVRIGTTPGGRNIVSPPALDDGQLTLPEMGTARNGSSTFYLLPPGTYYWSVQTVDNGFAGSPFATEQQFTIGPLLINPMRHADGSFEFSFTNQTVLNFDVLVSTNVASSLSNWMNLGPALPLGGGLYRFTDAGAISEMQRYYLLKEQ